MHGFLEALRVQRWDDHRYYHHSTINQALHLVSALSFVFAYAMIFKDPAVAVLVAWLVGMGARNASKIVVHLAASSSIAGEATTGTMAAKPLSI